MPLYPLNWKFLPPYTVPIVSQSRIEGVLNSIFATFNSPTYADGTSRISGSGVAWSFNRTSSVDSGSVRGVTAAVWCYPATMSVLSQSVMFMGTASAPLLLPSMTTNATFVANGLYVAVQKYANPFQYKLYNSASLFNSGSSNSSSISSSGFAPIMQTFSSIGTIHAWECQEAIAVAFSQTGSAIATALTFGGIAGAFVDPESTNTTVDCEIDGNLYGVATSGTVIGATFLNTTTDFLNHNVTAGNSKFVIYYPGTDVVKATAGLVEVRNMNSLTLSPKGSLIGFPNYVKDFINGRFLGRLREVETIRNSQTGMVFRTTGSDIGYAMGSSNIASLNAVMLVA